MYSILQNTEGTNLYLLNDKENITKRLENIVDVEKYEINDGFILYVKYLERKGNHYTNFIHGKLDSNGYTNYFEEPDVRLVGKFDNTYLLKNICEGVHTAKDESYILYNSTLKRRLDCDYASRNGMLNDEILTGYFVKNDKKIVDVLFSITDINSLEGIKLYSINLDKIINIYTENEYINTLNRKIKEEELNNSSDITTYCKKLENYCKEREHEKFIDRLNLTKEDFINKYYKPYRLLDIDIENMSKNATENLKKYIKK